MLVKRLWSLWLLERNFASTLRLEDFESTFHESWTSPAGVSFVYIISFTCSWLVSCVFSARVESSPEVCHACELCPCFCASCFFPTKRPLGVFTLISGLRWWVEFVFVNVWCCSRNTWLVQTRNCHCCRFTMWTLCEFVTSHLTRCWKHSN